MSVCGVVAMLLFVCMWLFVSVLCSVFDMFTCCLALTGIYLKK